MTLGEKLKEDLKNAFKGGDKLKTAVLRFLLSEIQNKEKEKQAQGKKPELADDEVVQALQKEFKKRREAIGLFKKGGREDLVASEEAELALIEEYVPKQLTREEAQAIVLGVISRGAADFNSVMKEAMKEMKGRADGKMVGEIIKERISN